MNKKIIFSFFAAGLFFTAGQLKAQLSSAKPAMTDVQVKDLIQQRSSVNSKQAATTVTTASSQTAVSASSNPASRTAQVKVTDVPVSESPAKTSTVTNSGTNISATKTEEAKVVTAPVIPVISNQGGVQPASSEPVKATEPQKVDPVKPVQVPVQNSKTE